MIRAHSLAAKALIMVSTRLANDANSNSLAHLLRSHRLNLSSWELAVSLSIEWSKWRFCEQLGSATAIMRQENMRPWFSARTCCLRLGEIPNYSAAARGFDPAVIIKKMAACVRWRRRRTSTPLREEPWRSAGNRIKKWKRKEKNAGSKDRLI